MQRNRNSATILSAVTFTASSVAAFALYAFLPFSRERYPVTGAVITCGLLASLLVFAVVRRLPDRRLARFVATSLVLTLALAPLVSALRPRITYARFGFTVFGITPIPALDLTIDRNGLLWFRHKSHQITRAEIEALVSDDVEIVIVGIGWQSVAALTEDAKQLADSVDMRVLPTPDAFALYNDLIASGHRVVLLAHSTC